MSQSPYSNDAFKRGAWQFLTGKGISALLTFAILLLLVRLLPVDEYGAYVTFVAVIEIGYALAGLGLPWLAARYLPDYRLNAPGMELVALCWRLLFWQVLALLGLAAIFGALLMSYLRWADLARYTTPAAICLGLMLVEGAARFLREGLMSPLMLQGELRASLVVRQTFFLGTVAIVQINGQVNLIDVIWAELSASAVGMAIAGYWLTVHIHGLRHRSGKLDWQAPSLAEQWRLAWGMYVAHLLTLTYSPQLFLSLIQRTQGSDIAALFGFLRNIQAQVARYLPATLLFSLVRPKLVAGFASGGGIQQLNRDANLAGKVSLFALMPLLVLSGLIGEELVILLSGGKFTDSGWLLAGFMIVLIPFSQRHLIETVAVVTGQARLCTWAATSGILLLPFTWVLLQETRGIWVVVLAIGLGYLIFNVIVLAGVTSRNGYKSDHVGTSKLAIAALGAYTIASMPIDLPGGAESGYGVLFQQSVLGITAFFILAWWLKPFTVAERNEINALIGRRLFIW